MYFLFTFISLFPSLSYFLLQLLLCSFPHIQLLSSCPTFLHSKTPFPSFTFPFLSPLSFLYFAPNHFLVHHHFPSSPSLLFPCPLIQLSVVLLLFMLCLFSSAPLSSIYHLSVSFQYTSSLLFPFFVFLSLSSLIFISSLLFLLPPYLALSPPIPPLPARSPFFFFFHILLSLESYFHLFPSVPLTHGFSKSAVLKFRGS